jgi:hypothetical protein
MANDETNENIRPVRAARRAIEKARVLPLAVLLAVLLWAGGLPHAAAALTCVDVQVTNDASGCVAVSVTGNTSGSAAAASLTGNSESRLVAVSGTSDAYGEVAVTLTGNAQAPCGVAFSVFGEYTPPITWECEAVAA